MPGMEIGVLGTVMLLAVVLVVLTFVLYLVPIPLWIAAWASGAYVGLFTLIGMRLRRVPPGTVVTARISSVKAGIDISINDLEAHFLAGGNVVRLVNAMISADKANIPLPFKRAAAIDLAGRDVLEAVQMSVIPKVIETPKIAAVAKDGIQLIAVCRVTVHEARRLVERFEWHYTPKHGSWLNLAESELAVLASQCLDRRIEDAAALSRQIKAWLSRRNANHAKASWRFTTAQARIKLKSLYPSL